MEEAMESSVSEGGEPLPGDEEMNTLREDETRRGDDSWDKIM